MNLENIKGLYFLGIGGIGMSGLARYFNAAGKTVWGYDKTKTSLTTELETEGIDIRFDEDLDHIKKRMLELKFDNSNMMIVYTPAVPLTHPAYTYFSVNGFQLKKRSEVLGMITAGAMTIAIAGTHGKTTTTTLVAHILDRKSVV